MQPKLVIVVPCYNEQEVLEKTHRVMKTYLDDLKKRNVVHGNSIICFVNDGSRDNTWQLIEKICQKDAHTRGIKLSRNFGHQGALVAGLMENKGKFDCYISIDADLQDDIHAIEEMLKAYQKGSKVVYGVRNDRSTDTWFKRQTAQGFYKFMQWMQVPTLYNHADFRLIDQRVLEELSNFKEVNLFLRGIVPLIGFQNEKVYYKRLEREAGESKYPLKKMLLFAWDGITSFSNFPMRLVLWFGFLNFFVAISVGVYTLFSYLSNETVPGWSSIVLPMAFFSGSNMVAIGLIGEYIGKIYSEVKERPRFITEKILN